MRVPACRARVSAATPVCPVPSPAPPQPHTIPALPCTCTHRRGKAAQERHPQGIASCDNPPVGGPWGWRWLSSISPSPFPLETRSPQTLFLTVLSYIVHLQRVRVARSCGGVSCWVYPVSAGRRRTDVPIARRIENRTVPKTVRRTIAPIREARVASRYVRLPYRS